MGLSEVLSTAISACDQMLGVLVEKSVSRAHVLGSLHLKCSLASLEQTNMGVSQN